MIAPLSGGAAREHGFTLVELMVALFIFGLLSAAGVGLLAYAVRAEAATAERLSAVADLRRAGALLSADLAQAVARPTRDERGAPVGAFSGDGGSMLLVRGGWSNSEGAARPSLQKVEYRINRGRLVRRAWPMLDGSAPGTAAVLLQGVERMRLRFRTEGVWRERWDPVKLDVLPDAAELAVQTAASGEIRQLFLVGAGR